MNSLALLGEFRAETSEHLNALDARMVELERHPEDRRPLRELFRSAHTIKGGAALLGLTDVLELAHALEDVLGSLRDAHAQLERATIELLFRAIDALRDLAPRAQPGSPRRNATGNEIILALRQEASRIASPHPVVDSPDEAAARQVLVVDDSATVRMLATMALSDVGFGVVAVADGTQALTQAHVRRFDLVVTSIETAGLGGFELIAALRQIPGYSDVPVIVNTTSTDVAGLRQRAAGLGVRAFLTKGSLRDRQLVEAATALVPLPIAPLRVLLVDDSALQQRVGRHMLQILGYRVDVADDGNSALLALTEVDYSAVLMDCHLAGMDGFETTRQIRRSASATTRRTPIIALTAATQAEDRAHCLASGMNDILTKPVQPADLEACLTRWTQPSTFAVPEILQPPVDTTVLLALRAMVQPGQPDPVAPLLELFVHESRDRLADCAEAVRLGDTTKLAAAAHALKGNNGTFGAGEMHRLATDLELGARSGSIGAAQGILAEMDGEFVRVVQALDAFRSEIQSGALHAR